MFRYYTALVFISISALISIQFCIRQSTTLNKAGKRIYHWLFAMIAVAALCEWLGVCLQGTGSRTRILHIALKAVELSTAPCISVCFAWAIERWRPKAVVAFLTVHVLLEWLSGIFGWIYRVDENSVYTHGPFYWIYVAAYLITIAYCIIVIFRNLRKYQYNGSAYFLSTVVVMLVGIVIQLCWSELRVVYFTLAITSIMVYVFTLEMIQQTDSLTQLLNRRGFDNYISHIDENCTIVFFDVDGFKHINDTYGHTYGDLVLQKVGKAIWSTYMKYGKCFRYGGDEFCVILTKKTARVEALNASFFQTLSDCQTQDSRFPGVSIGYALYVPEVDHIREALERADQMMYREKAKRKEREAARTN